MSKLDDIRSKGKNTEIDKFSNFDLSDGSLTSSRHCEEHTGDEAISPIDCHASQEQEARNDYYGGQLRNRKNAIKHQRINFDLNFSYKSLFVSAFICFLLIFSLAKLVAAKNNSEKLTNEAQDHLQQSFSMIENGDTGEAIKEADEAKKDIEKLKLLAQSWGQDIQYLRFASASNSRLLASERLLNASYDIIGTLTSVRSELSKISFGEKSSSESGFKFNISNNQKIFLSAINNGKDKLNRGKLELLSAKKGLPKDQITEIDNAVTAIDKAISLVDSYQTILEKNLTWLSGADGKEKNILVLFQNNSELRGGSGGSLGSFGIAKFKDGSLTNIDFGVNIYKIDQAFRAKEKIPAPDQLNWVVPEGALTMKDSGFDIDGPKAMEKIMWFYNQETGNQVDGVLMVDTTAVILLLKEIGPIEVKKMGKTINSENFRQEVEYEVHQGYFNREGGKEENEPKKILALMMPQFLDKLFGSVKSSENSPKIFSSLSQSLKQKDITMYFANDEFEKNLTNLNYSANVYPTLGDYFYVNNSNIDGAKSSSNIEETIKLSTNISKEGKIINSLDLLRNHTGSGEWPDGINKNYIRLLLPENSDVISFNTIEGYFEQLFDKGFKDGKPYWLTDDYGKKIVNFWMSTKPKEKSEVKIQYQPKYDIDTTGDFNYVITFQKQPGAPNDNIEFELNYPDGVKPQNVKNFDKDNKKILIKLNLDQDRTIKIKFKKN